MKEINKLEEYLNERSNKRKKRNKLFAGIGLVAVLAGAGSTGFWAYNKYVATEKVPIEEQPDIAGTNTIENDAAGERILNESPPAIVEHINKFPSLSIEGQFEVGKPLDFVIKNNNDVGRHYIDFGDNKNMNIKNTTKHVYRTAGEYQIKFTPAGMNESVVETINIQRRNGSNSTEATFAKVIETIESQKSEKAFVNLQNETNATFPGGSAALMSFIQTRMGDVSGYKGRVLVGFDIKSDGSVTNLKILDSDDTSINQQILMAFNGMPKWTPAKREGIDVDSEYRMPFYFQKDS